VLKLALNGQTDNETAARLRALLSPYRGIAGTCPVRIQYRNDTAETELALPDAWRVRLEDRLIDELHEWLSPDNVHLIYG